MTVLIFDGQKWKNTNFVPKSAFNRDFGTEQYTVCEGNDPRLSNNAPLTIGSDFPTPPTPLFYHTTENKLYVYHNDTYVLASSTNTTDLDINDIINVSNIMPADSVPFWWDTTDGNLYVRYLNNYVPATSVVSGGGSNLDTDSVISISDTVPTPPTPLFYWNNVNGNLYVKYNNQYVLASTSSSSSNLDTDSIISISDITPDPLTPFFYNTTNNNLYFYNYSTSEYVLASSTNTTDLDINDIINVSNIMPVDSVPFWWDTTDGNLYVRYNNNYVSATSINLDITSIITINAVQPDPPTPFWWDSVEGNLYIYYNSQYVSSTNLINIGSNLPSYDLNDADKVLSVNSTGDGIQWSIVQSGGSTGVHNLIDTTNHTVTGLTSGHFLKALSDTTYGFAAHGITASDVGAEPVITVKEDGFNKPFAIESEALLGVITDKIMSPFTTKSCITDSIGDIENSLSLILGDDAAFGQITNFNSDNIFCINLTASDKIKSTNYISEQEFNIKPGNYNLGIKIFTSISDYLNIYNSSNFTDYVCYSFNTNSSSPKQHFLGVTDDILLYTPGPTETIGFSKDKTLTTLVSKTIICNAINSADTVSATDATYADWYNTTLTTNRTRISSLGCWTPLSTLYNWTTILSSNLVLPDIAPDTTDQTNFVTTFGYGSSGVPSKNNRTITLNSVTGNIHTLGTLSPGATFSDYVEYFKNNEGVEILPGMLVTLNNNGVNIAKLGDEINGVVSHTGGIILGNNSFCWQGRYLKDEWGRPIYEQIHDPNWKSEIVDPDNPQQLIPNPNPQQLITVLKENPDYNPNLEQVPRSQRPNEWTPVGLLGQVHVRVDDTVVPNCRIKSGNNGIGTLSTERTGLRCLQINQVFDIDLGYAIAYCFINVMA